MEVPPLLDLRTAKVEGIVLEELKLLRLDAPLQTFGLWSPPAPPSTSSILQTLRLPKAPHEDAQCQASIQIDPLSDLVKKHVKESVRTHMSFSEVVDVKEEDYALREKEREKKGGKKEFDVGRFVTKAEFGDGERRRTEDPMEHYKETWEFQQKYMQNRLKACSKAASSLLQDLSSTTSDFHSLNITPNLKSEKAEELRLRQEQETLQRTKVAEELLAKNKELISEVDAMLAKADRSEPAEDVPVKESPVQPAGNPKYRSSLALTKRLTTAFETASKAVSISTRSKELAKPKRKLYNSSRK